MTTNIKALREAAGFTQQALADAAGISRSTLVRIELGLGIRPGYQNIQRIASALHCRPEDIVSTSALNCTVDDLLGDAEHKPA